MIVIYHPSHNFYSKWPQDSFYKYTDETDPNAVYDLSVSVWIVPGTVNPND